MLEIPTPGVFALSARLVASAGAVVVCGLLIILWFYRRRDFIARWAAAWAVAGVALFVVSRADVAGGLTWWELAGANAAAGACVLFLSGLRRYLGGSGWRLEALTVASLVVLASASAALSRGPMLPFAAAFLAMAAVLAACAWQAGGIAYRRRFVGAGVMAGAFGLVTLTNAATAVAMLMRPIGTGQSRALLVLNGAACLMVAFGQHLFVFEDMLLELRESNHELLATKAELSFAAITDALTGLYNRRFFDEVTSHHLEHHRRFHLPLSLVYVDVDRFKAVNDTKGHAVGDRVLRHVADYVRRRTREADYVFRVGGDEFVVLMSCAPAEAERRARELQHGFHATLVEADLPGSLGLSVGIADVTVDAHDFTHAMAMADERMYEDKRHRTAAFLGE